MSSFPACWKCLSGVWGRLASVSLWATPLSTFFIYSDLHYVFALCIFSCGSGGFMLYATIRRRPLILIINSWDWSWCGRNEYVDRDLHFHQWQRKTVNRCSHYRAEQTSQCIYYWESAGNTIKGYEYHWLMLLCNLTVTLQLVKSHISSRERNTVLVCKSAAHGSSWSSHYPPVPIDAAHSRTVGVNGMVGAPNHWAETYASVCWLLHSPEFVVRASLSLWKI